MMDDPRPRIGVVGAGQLARMCRQAAVGLDIDVQVLAARPDDAAARISPDPRIGDPDDPATVIAFGRGCDVLTLDHELVDRGALERLAAEGHLVRPSAAALHYAQDKAYQRTRFAAAGLPVPAFEVVTDERDVIRFADKHGWPLVLKRPRGGYDGRGVWHVPGPQALAAAWQEAAATGPVLVEEAVAIECEIAVVLARRPGGEVVTTPAVETVQDDGMLRELVVPARVPAVVGQTAGELAGRVAELVDVVGICAVELFWNGSDLLINEIATRPHNSGHWTIDAATTSQFENHVRAVLDWPLGAMDATSPAVCSVNVVGPDDITWPQVHLPAALRDPQVHVHLYGKQPRTGRKLGHVTATGATVDEARDRAHHAADILMTPSRDRRPMIRPPSRSESTQT